MKPTAEHKQVISNIAGSCLSVRLRLLNRIVTSIFDEAVRPHGIKASQIAILVAISGLEKSTSRQLCRALHMDTSTFSRALSILKKNQWVETEPSGEGKILKLEVTAKGFEKLMAVHPAWEKAQQKAIEILGEKTARTFIESGTQHLLSGMTT